ELTEIHRFVIRFVKEGFGGPTEVQETVSQCYEIGANSLTWIYLMGIITSVVFTKQSRPSLADLGAQAMLPAVLSIDVLRALAPLVTALIAAGKVGSQIGAELGSMKVSEQIEAMEVSGINPFKFLVVSRVVATSIMIPILMLYVALVALLGAYLNIAQNEATSIVVYFTEVFDAITFRDIFSSIIKSLVFGFTIGIVGCYQGY